MKKMFSSRKAQNLTELALVIGIVAIAFIGMEVYFRRGLQAGIKNMTNTYMTGNLASPANQAAYAMDTHNYVVMQGVTPMQSNSSVHVATSTSGGGYVTSNTKAEVLVGSVTNPATSQSVASY